MALRAFSVRMRFMFISITSCAPVFRDIPLDAWNIEWVDFLTPTGCLGCPKSKWNWISQKYRADFVNSNMYFLSGLGEMNELFNTDGICKMGRNWGLPATECSLRGDVNGSYAKIPADSQLQLSDGVSPCEVAFGYRNRYCNPPKRDFKFTNLNSLIPRVMHTNYCSPQLPILLHRNGSFQVVFWGFRFTYSRTCV